VSENYDRCIIQECVLGVCENVNGCMFRGAYATR